MLISFQHGGRAYQADLSQPIDLSMPLLADGQGVNCFYAPWVEYSPVRAGDFVGSTAEGGGVNFYNIRVNPHGNGTHTECVGHIAQERYVLYDCLKESHFLAKLISIYPQRMDDGDRVITKEQLAEALQPGEATALIIRTFPNDDLKRRTNYSGANPPYIQADAITYMVECGIEHLLIDLPSVDREEDGGRLAAHKAFWQYPGPDIRTKSTITELIYVLNDVKDGYYLLNIQTAPFDLDASPSRPTVFPISSAS